MTSKERMLRALNRETPDRLPVTIHQWQGCHLDKYLGGMSDLEAFRKFGLDAAIAYFEAVGQFVSYPFGWMSTWMLYGLLVLVAAKILGGRATVQQMLGCTALAAVPFILGIFGFIPQLGYWPGLIAFLWGLVIYVMGTAVANEFGIGKAILAVILPILVIPLVGLVRLLDDLLPYSHRHDRHRRTANGG